MSPDKPDPVTVLIVNYNSGDWLRRCLVSLEPDAQPALPVMVLDNASSDNSITGLPPYAGLTLHQSPRNLGFAPGVNKLAARVETAWMLVLNPDCLISRPGLDTLLARARRDAGLALLSGCVVDQDGREQRGSRRRFPTPARVAAEYLPALRRAGRGVDLTETERPRTFQRQEAVSGACMLIRARAFREVGGMDEGYPMHFEDLDLMARLHAAGWRIGWEPCVRILHAGGVSSASRPAAVHWGKHAGLWRYLSRHGRMGVLKPMLWSLIWIHAIVTWPRIFRRRQEHA